MVFFSRIEFLLLLKNTPNFKVERKYGYVKECMILNYVKPKIGRKKSRSLQPKPIYFFEKNVYPIPIGQVLPHSYI